jgi:2-dehydropantoate 2-reductase
MRKIKKEREFRVGVIGLGPVGATLAVHLQEAGASVTLCEISSKVVDAVKESGLTLTNVFEKHADFSRTCNSVQAMEMFDLDLAIISVKTPHLKKVVEQLAEIDSEKLFVMCAQNGIDNELEVARLFGEERTLRMVVNYAGNMSSLNSVHVSFFNPPNYLAALSPRGEPVANRVVQLLNSVGLETKIPSDIQDNVWEKAILNAALSAVCAITRRTMKEVMDSQETVELVEGIIDESVRVAEMEKVELGRKFRRFCIRYLKNAGHHRTSMLIDLENGQPTEIDHLNGKIVCYGRKHCLPTPLNQMVTALIHTLERPRTFQATTASR